MKWIVSGWSLSCNKQIPCINVLYHFFIAWCSFFRGSGSIYDISSRQKVNKKWPLSIPENSCHDFLCWWWRFEFFHWQWRFLAPLQWQLIILRCMMIHIFDPHFISCQIYTRKLSPWLHNVCEMLEPQSLISLVIVCQHFWHKKHGYFWTA